MAHSRAEVLTPFASKYLVQLSKHWSHKFAVEWDPTHSRIPLGAADCRLEATDDKLIADLDADEADMERMQGVVANHVNRFAFKEGELTFDWVRV